MKYDILALTHNFSNALQWNYGREGAGFASVLAVAAATANVLFGGWDNTLKLLVWFMVADFVFGIVASFKKKTTDSQIMFWGGVNKVIVLSLVGIGALLDSTLGMTNPYIRTVIIWFYIGREGLSILENLGKLGMDLPPKLKETFVQLAAKGESNDNYR